MATVMTRNLKRARTTANLHTLRNLDERTLAMIFLYLRMDELLTFGLVCEEFGEMLLINKSYHTDLLALINGAFVKMHVVNGPVVKCAFPLVEGAPSFDESINLDAMSYKVALIKNAPCKPEDVRVLSLNQDLVTLSLSCGPIHQEALEMMHTIKGLEFLSLGYTEVTDAGLLALSKCETLHTLGLYHCRGFTEACLTALHEALPRLTITREDPPQ